MFNDRRLARSFSRPVPLPCYILVSGTCLPRPHASRRYFPLSRFCARAAQISRVRLMWLVHTLCTENMNAVVQSQARGARSVPLRRDRRRHPSAKAVRPEPLPLLPDDIPPSSLAPLDAAVHYSSTVRHTHATTAHDVAEGQLPRPAQVRRGTPSRAWRSGSRPPSLPPFPCVCARRYINDFSKALASEVRILLAEVGKLRDERRQLQ